jgi:penicillin amidase
VALARTSEILGPAAIDVDRSLRILGLTRAVPTIAAALPEATRRWLGSFVRGINHHLAEAPQRPPEFHLLGIACEPWNLCDILSIGRLAAIDVNWIVWARLLKLRSAPGWPKLWGRLMQAEMALLPSFAGAGLPIHHLTHVLGHLHRSGSNAFAVGASRSATGAAWLAGDPHLSVSLPNLWLMGGYRSPSYHAVGLMIPGVPAIAIGRNPWSAWGGTNLHAASSDLHELSPSSARALTVREETFKVRWWPRQRVRIRETAHGPILSDAPALRSTGRTTFALRWVGHDPTDETSALLAVNRARSWAEFRAALDGFAIPGQNMLYADTLGHIGWLVAAKLPRRPSAAPADLLAPAVALSHWREFVTARDLPWRHDPQAGFIASANDRPEVASVTPIGFFFSAGDRVNRLKQCLANSGPIDFAAVARLQRDVFGAASARLRDMLVYRARGLPPEPRRADQRGHVLATLEQWDGRYAVDSAGALACELLLHHLARRLCDADTRRAYGAGWMARTLLSEDLEQTDPEAMAAALGPALDATARGLARFGWWGRMHRLRLAHPLAAAPIVGHRFVFADLPASGSSETLMKTAHPLSAERHVTDYGSNARYIFNLADPDANDLVLLGGQDGWLGSTTFLDQVALWERGAYIRVPLGREAVRTSFPHRTELTPDSHPDAMGGTA